MSSTSPLAFLGLGAMGSRMAARLLGSGHHLRLYNRTPAAAETLAGPEGIVCDTPRAAVAGCQVVLACLRDDAAARGVWLDPEHGALANMPAGSVAIDSSTLTPACVRELSAAAAARGVAFLDAPVVGSRPQAEAGALVHLVGGDAEVFARVAPVLAHIGRAAHHLGPSGSGAWLKLIVNALLGIQVTALAELLSLLEPAGCDPAAAFEVLAGLPVMSPAATGAGRLMLAGEDAPQFPVALVEKDLGYAVSAGASVGAALPTTDFARERFTRAHEAGLGDRNLTALGAWCQTSNAV